MKVEEFPIMRTWIECQILSSQDMFAQICETIPPWSCLAILSSRRKEEYVYDTHVKQFYEGLNEEREPVHLWVCQGIPWCITLQMKNSSYSFPSVIPRYRLPKKCAKKNECTTTGKLLKKEGGLKMQFRMVIAFLEGKKTGRNDF